MEGGAALRRVAVVVPEHAAEPFMALDFADFLNHCLDILRMFGELVQPATESFSYARIPCDLPPNPVRFLQRMDSDFLTGVITTS